VGHYLRRVESMRTADPPALATDEHRSLLARRARGSACRNELHGLMVALEGLRPRDLIALPGLSAVLLDRGIRLLSGVETPRGRA